jgi:hypothetical protein
MRSKPLNVLIALLVTAAVLFSSGMAVAQGHPLSVETRRVGAKSVGAQDILYDQISTNISPTGVISQNFETNFNSYDNQAADDFTIQAGSYYWLVTQVEVMGHYLNPGYQASSVNVYLHNSTGSLPASSFFASSFIPVGGLDTGSFVINLGPGVGLPSGRQYWLSVQANLDSGCPQQQGCSARQWQWRERTGGEVGSASAWLNILGGWWPDCTTWKPRLTECGFGSYPDLLFSLSGSLVPINTTIYFPFVLQ